jgi:hypothetical protein
LVSILNVPENLGLTFLEKIVQAQEYLCELLGPTSTTPVLLGQKSEAARKAVFLVL